MGTLSSLSFDDQLQATYVGYFGRAGDSGGVVYWENSGLPILPPALDQSSITESFSQQTETDQLYPQLPSILAYQAANPGGNASPPAATVNAVTAFVNEVYLNEFNRPLAASDGTYWVDQILGTTPGVAPLDVGTAIFLIGDGSTGADAATLLNKIAVGDSFTNQTSAAGLGFGTPTADYLQEAHTVVGATTSDPATVTTQQAAVTAFVTGASAPTFTLTPDIDSFSATAAGAVFNAAPFVTPGSGLANNTLNAGDVLQDSAGDGTLNFTATGVGVANPPFATNVLINGVSTLNYTATGTVGTDVNDGGFQGNVTGLTTVNDTGSAGNLTVGGTGQGLNTPLANVNISGYGGTGAFQTAFSGTIASSVANAAAGINIAITGAIGSLAPNGAVALQIQNDGNMGTAAAPNLSYGGWNLTVGSTSFLQLEQGGVGGATGLKLNGAGNLFLGSDGVGNWQDLTNIDASATTGTVVITGASSGVFGNAFGSATDPFWDLGSAAGLLDEGASGTFDLTSFLLGSGKTVLDVSSASPTNLAALTTTPGGTVATDNVIIVNNGVANTLSTTTFANIAGFQELGVTAPAGVINMANLPTSINEIIYVTGATGAPVTINNAIDALTVDFAGNNNGGDLTVNGPTSATATLSLDFGNAALGFQDNAGVITANAYSTVNIASVGDNVAGDINSTVALDVTSTVVGVNSGALTVNISGTQDFTAGSVNDIPGTGSTNGPTSAADAINVTDTGNINLGITNFGTVSAAPSSSLVVSDTFHNSTITGSATGNNTLTGGDGGGAVGTGNTITGGSATDHIVTGIGANVINLGTTHANDVITIGSGFGGVITDPGDVVNPGAWGVAFGTAGPLTIAGPAATSVFDITGPNGGTSASQTVINHFSTATSTGDTLHFQAGLWDASVSPNSIGGVDAGLRTIDLFPVLAGDAVLPETATSGGVLTPGANLIELTGTGSQQSSAAGVAAILQTTYSLTTGFLPGGDNTHFLVAYTDGNNIHIADVDIYATGAGGAASNAAGNHVYASDMVELAGVNSFTALNPHLGAFV